MPIPILINPEKTINALRDARRYIRTVEAWRHQDVAHFSLAEVVEEFTTGGEVETVDDALGDLGVWF